MYLCLEIFRLKGKHNAALKERGMNLKDQTTKGKSHLNNAGPGAGGRREVLGGNRLKLIEYDP